MSGAFYSGEGKVREPARDLWFFFCWRGLLRDFEFWHGLRFCRARGFMVLGSDQAHSIQRLQTGGPRVALMVGVALCRRARPCPWEGGAGRNSPWGSPKASWRGE